VRGEDRWSLDIPAAPAPGIELLRRVAVEPLDCADVMEAEAEAAAERLDPDAGLMVQAVWFDFGSDRPGRLLLVVHHLAVDIVSWSVIGDDLADLGTGTDPLPPTTSFRTYSHRLADLGAHPDVHAQLPYWERVLSGADPLIGGRPLDPTVDTGRTTDTLSVTLGSDITTSILGRLAGAFHARMDDVLLTALALAVAEWRRRAGQDVPAACLVALERHGRDADPLSALDLSATVGWFTTIAPVRLDLTGIDAAAALAGEAAAGAALEAVKEQLRSVPAAGFHYGLLRWVAPDGAARLGALEEPQILFNYGGRSDLGDTGDWAAAADDVDFGDGSDAMPAGHVLEINAEITDTGEGPALEVAWAWPTGVLNRADVESLAALFVEALHGLVAHSAAPGAGSQTPLDFPLVNITRADLDDLASRVGTLADVLPATPLQEGFYFHSVLEEGHDPYLPQVVFDAGSVDAPVDPFRLRRSLEALLDRHPNLRAGFCQLASGAVVSVVPRDAPVPWREVDLAAVPDADQPAAVDRLAEEDLAAGFDQSRPPLLRATLAGLGQGRSRLIVTSHHALMDGWSLPLFFDELAQIYDADGDDSGLEPVRPFRDYLAWLATGIPGPGRPPGVRRSPGSMGQR